VTRNFQCPSSLLKVSFQHLIQPLSDYLLTYLENYGPLGVLIYLRTQKLANEASIGDADIDELFYLNLSQDYVRFM
jgi:hypothetical protein